MDRKKAIPTVQVYEGRRGAWYWRMIAANGRIKADGGEDYSTKAAAIKGLETTVLPPYKLVVMASGPHPEPRPQEFVGITYPTGVSESDNPRNYGEVEIETVR